MNDLEFDEKGHTIGPGTFPMRWNKEVIDIDEVDDLCLTDEQLKDRRAKESGELTAALAHVHANSERFATVDNTPIVSDETIEEWREEGYIAEIKKLDFAEFPTPEVDRKDMTNKHSPSLLPIEADVAFSKVSDYGFAKYGNRDTWMNSPPTEGVRRYLDAAIRHAKQHAQEGELDRESKLPHVYAVLWNAAAAVWHYEKLIEQHMVDQGIVT